MLVAGARGNASTTGVLVVALLLLMPGTVHAAPASSSATSSSCWIYPIGPSLTPIPCGITLSATIAPGACSADDVCSYTINATATGWSGAAGLLHMVVRGGNGDDFNGACVGSKEFTDTTGIIQPACGWICDVHSAGETVQCTASVTRAIHLPAGTAAGVLVDAMVDWNLQTEYAGEDLFFDLARDTTGALDAYPLQ
jgi:hypothetical protein